MNKRLSYVKSIGLRPEVYQALKEAKYYPEQSFSNLIVALLELKRKQKEKAETIGQDTSALSETPSPLKEVKP